MTVTIEKQGRRFYIKGNTYAIKDRLKSAGCKWDADSKCWYTGKKEIADKLAGTELPAAKSGGFTKPTTDDLSNRRCDGKVEYKGRTYYVVGRSQAKAKLWLTVLDCSIEFWAAEAECKWVKRYEAREERGNYGRVTGRMVYQSVGKIRDFIERSKRDEATVKSGGTPDGWCVDLEDGCLKPRNECDMPSN